MEKAKYYTPTIEEFHIGFEFEQRANDLDWKSFTIKSFENLHTLSKGLNEVLEHPITDKIFDDFEVRVKYLDSDDITDLGFAQVYVPNCNTEDDDIQYGFELEVSESCFILLHFMGDKVSIVKQDIYDSFTSNWTAEHLFLGVINNKSELKRLLKQFEICQK